MNDTKYAYCRLCAKLKSNNNLTDLQNSEPFREKIESSLKRLNCNLDFTESLLPKTVCLTCINTLNCVYTFIESIDSAQVVLNETFLQVPNIKKENNDGDLIEVEIDAPITTEPTEIDSIAVKTENATDIEIKVEYDNDVLEEEDVTKTNNVTTEVNTYLNWRDYSWKCRSCETQFSTITELINHSMTYHKVCNAFSCIDCNTKRGNLEKFLNHVRNHHNKLRLSCYECFKTCTDTPEYNKHRHTHRITDFKCRGCHTYFQSSDELTKHTSTFLSNYKFFLPLEPEQGLICELCKKVFKTKASLVTHLLSHTDRKRDHTCDICGKCFYNKFQLAAHMELHNNPGNPQFQCNICKSTFRTKYYLQNHITRHNNIKLPCTKCDKSFGSVKTLNAHQIVHTDSMPHACSYCSKKFKFKTCLNVHLRQHTGAKPYTCDICQRDFTNGSNYTKHMKRIHNKDLRKKMISRTDYQLEAMETEGQDQ